MKAIIGLGNIGDKYANTRHNIGFMVLDLLAERLAKENIEIIWKNDKKLLAQVAKTTINKQDYILAKPQTMMNLSGESASKISNFYKIKPEDFIVIYDDLDLPTGAVRTRKKGSAGTHNGMKSILQHAGTEEVPRVRVGIEARGETAPAQQDTSDYVLSNFLPEELPKIDEAIGQIVSQILQGELLLD